MQAQAIKLDGVGVGGVARADLHKCYAEYLAFKALQEAIFSKTYKYVFGKLDHEIWQDALCEKYT